MTAWQQKFHSLKQNPLFPFHDYRKNDEEYRLSELYWQYLFLSVVGDDAVRWPRGAYALDTEREGNGILCAVDVAAKRGTRAVQMPQSPRGGFDLFHPYLSIDPFDPVDYDNPERLILNLVMICEISEEAEALCRDFWRWHFIDRSRGRDRTPH